MENEAFSGAMLFFQHLQLGKKGCVFRVTWPYLAKHPDRNVFFMILQRNIYEKDLKMYFGTILAANSICKKHINPDPTFIFFPTVAWNTEPFFGL